MIGEHETALEKALLQFVFNAQLAEVSALIGAALAGTYPDTAVPIRRVQWILDQALCASTPDLLIRVIRRADIVVGKQLPQALMTLADQLENGQRAWLPGGLNDPLVIESDDLPFLDRKDARQLLATNGEAAESPLCTLISGDPGAGKTYLWRYAKHLSKVRRDLKLVPVAVPQTSVSSYLPEALALELALGLGTDLGYRPAFRPDVDAHTEELVGWLASFTPKRTPPALVLLDGLDNEELPKWVHTFVSKLLQRLYEPTSDASERFRVVLFGYDSGALSRAGFSEFAPHVLGHIDRVDIAEWLEKRYPGQASGKYEYASSFVANQIPPNGPNRLLMLNTYVRFVARDFV